MPRPYKPSVADNLDEIIIQLGWMRYAAPTFRDPSFDEMYPGRDFDVVFFELREGLARFRTTIGDRRYQAAVEMMNRMRLLFEADPNDTTGQTREGRHLIQELQSLLEKVADETEAGR
jgi:hypothetical protein